METVFLKKDDFISVPAGAHITFHGIDWDQSKRQSNISVGGSLRYNTISKATTKAHTHEFAEFFLIIEGKIRHIINGEQQELETGTLVFIRPSDRHYFEQFNNSACKLINVAFKLEFLLDLSQYLGNDYFMRNYTGPVISPIFKLSLKETENLANELIRMNTLQRTSTDLARLKIKILLARIFSNYFLEQPSHMTRNLPPWFENLCNSMNKIKNLKKGLQHMKKEAPCTQEHLCKCFQKYMDRTPTDFITELRIKKAAQKLIETDKKILAISLQLGFQSLSYFYKMFKKYYGVSPGRYRKISQQNEIPI
ncbi:MAG: AraC family transcriptional regulator [Candidatus Marinimicrobia bacterium]|nr:AraC family transcriptional regulator [Candidatus Neomarinimicrobiota bacterium]